MRKIQMSEPTKKAWSDFFWLGRTNWASIVIMVIVVLEIIDALRPLP